MMGGYGYGYGPMMGGGGWLGLVLMGLFWLIILAGVILLVVWIARSSMHHGGPSTGAPGHDEAVAIARRRLANGEITKDQFDEIMRSLGS